MASETDGTSQVAGSNRSSSSTVGERGRAVKKCPRHAARNYRVQREELLCHGYLLGEYLGEGSSAVVRSATVLPKKLHDERIARVFAKNGNLTNKVAVKIFEVRDAPRDFVDMYLPREITALRTISRHENIIQFIEDIQTRDRVYIISELCQSGTLLSKINFGEAVGETLGLDEEKSKRYFRQLCKAILHCHRYGFAHRDLKLENLLLDQVDNIKLCDFGFAVQVDACRVINTFCGSYAYAAPELLMNRSYDAQQADIWSLGVILFTMVNGRVPYDDDRIPVMDDLMKKQKLVFTKKVTDDFTDLCKFILQYTPYKRPTIQQIFRHPWMRSKRTPQSIHHISPECDCSYATPTSSTVYARLPAINQNDMLANIRSQTIKRLQGETVTLRSRSMGKQNAYALATARTLRGGKGISLPQTVDRERRPATSGGTGGDQTGAQTGQGARKLGALRSAEQLSVVRIGSLRSIGSGYSDAQESFRADSELHSNLQAYMTRMWDEAITGSRQPPGTGNEAKTRRQKDGHKRDYNYKPGTRNRHVVDSIRASRSSGTKLNITVTPLLPTIDTGRGVNLTGGLATIDEQGERQDRCQQLPMPQYRVPLYQNLPDSRRVNDLLSLRTTHKQGRAWRKNPSSVRGAQLAKHRQS